MNHLMRELCIINRQKQSLLQSVLFFLMFTAFFPLTLPYDASMLRMMCPGIIWLAFVL